MAGYAPPHPAYRAGKLSLEMPKNDMRQTNWLVHTLLCVWLAGAFHPACASPLPPTDDPVRSDSAILFRFVPGKRMFYSPFRGNDESIRRAVSLIDRHRQDIEAGHAYVMIRGFCGSFGSQAENLAAAKNRSNQVKSWFITHHGMKEQYYRTYNSTRSYQGIRDVVALLGIEYAEGYEPEVKPEPVALPADSLERDTLDVIEEADTLAALPDTTAMAEPEVLPADEQMAEETTPVVREYVRSPWSIKTNLVYDAVLMPSLEVAYRFNDRWSAGVEGNMAWWHNNGKHKYYQLATIVPEARYWFKPQGDRRGHYVGLFAGGGWYDLENGGRGYKGEGVMAGLSYGYMFPVGRYFAFEAGIGIGFMHTWYDEYLPIDGHYVYQQSSRLNYFGPLKLKFAWVWNIGKWMEKKGGKR